MATPANLMNPRPRRRVWWLLLLLLLVAAAAYWFYFMPARDAQPRPGGGRFGAGGPRVTPVAVAPAKTANVDIYLNGLGSVTPVGTVTVRTRIDGQLMRVHFSEGQVVKQGDLLAEIDPRPYQVQLAQAQGQMQKDEALLANARLDLERYRTLFAQDSGSKQQLDTQAALVRQYEGAVKIDQSQIDNARLQLEYCRIVAPISGRLGLRQVDPGNMVRAGDAAGLVVITQLTPIAVVFTLPEDNVQRVMERLRAGAKPAVEAYDRAGKVKLAAGTLITLDNQIDPATGAVKLKAQFDNRDLRLFPSQFVNVRMLIEVLKDATVVPGPAVQRGARGTFVYVVKPDRTVTLRTVKLGQTQGQNVVVEDGLAVGDVVVIDGAERLREGASVELPGEVPPAGARSGSGSGAASGSSAKNGSGKDAQRRGPSGASSGTTGADAGPGPGGSGGAGADVRTQLLMQQERDGFRERMQNASSPEERGRIRDEARALAAKRAKEKGVTLPPGERGGGGGGAR